ncbi:hypothetical protein ACFXMT_14180 [Streptomyces mirabilis]|uniref:hypothetical protein n=1 Tax=Streptomyces mirabilis TaxID=68239 RepID=UPI0036C59A0F
MTFAAEQKVKYKGMVMPATIISGPHQSTGADRYLIRKADGNVSLAPVGMLTALLSRRETVARIMYSRANSRAWESTSEPVRRSYLRTADEILTALDELPDDAVPLAAGDMVRILRNGQDGARVTKGDVLTVRSVESTSFTTNDIRGLSLLGKWVFQLAAEGVGWERV